MIDHEPDPLLDPRYSWQATKPPRRLPWRLTLGGLREDATLGSAELSRVNARGAHFARADLAGSVLYEALLIAADLEGANLQDVDLRLVDLREARLEGADLRDAWYNDTTRWPEDFDPEAAGAVFRH